MCLINKFVFKVPAVLRILFLSMAIVSTANAQLSAPSPDAPSAKPSRISASHKSLPPALSQLQKSVFLVGHAKQGYGTAWVVSKRRRLLATNAHVADIMHKAGEMFAIQNDTSKRMRVKRVWYHPGLRRLVEDKRSMVVRSTDPATGPVDVLSPDVAVLQLENAGPNLESELRMASLSELKMLLSDKVSMFGFPGHDTQEWPAQGERALATLHAGVVTRITDFTSRGNDFSKSQLLQYSIPTWPGFSGSPVVLSNGHVVGLNHMGRLVEKNYGGNPEKRDIVEVKSIAHGVRIDCLWELLFHHGLDKKVSISVDRSKLDIARWLKDHPYEARVKRVLKMISDASKKRKAGQHEEAVALCDEAKKAYPQYAKAHLHSMISRVEMARARQRKLSHNDVIELFERARIDGEKYLRMKPSDPQGTVWLAETLFQQGIFELPPKPPRNTRNKRNPKEILTIIRKSRMHALSSQGLELLLIVKKSNQFRWLSKSQRLSVLQQCARILLAHHDIQRAFRVVEECLRINKDDPRNHEYHALCQWYDVGYGRYIKNDTMRRAAQKCRETARRLRAQQIKVATN